MVDVTAEDGSDKPLPEEDMEEGELSDDPEAAAQEPAPGMLRKPGTGPHGKEGVRMDIPDLLKEIGGADMIVDEETAEKINRRAARFQTGGSISFPQVSALYRAMNISSDPEQRAGHRLEVVHVWSQSRLEVAELQRFFREFQPLSIDLVGKTKANVSWATAANSAKAILGLSKAIGEAELGKKVKHVIGMEDEVSTVVEDQEVVATGDVVHPEDIGIELPQGGPWRLAVRDDGEEGEELPVLLLRFGRDSDLFTERRAPPLARPGRFSDPVGIISRSKREELLAEQERALEREDEAKAPVDKRDPWGSVAVRWAEEQRGSRAGGRGPLMLGGVGRKDWDAPEDEDEVKAEGRGGKGGVRDRLDYGARVEEEDHEDDMSEEDMGWSEKMKRPRMGMVADLVEKKTVARQLSRNMSSRDRSPEDMREVIKRKVPNSRVEFAKEEDSAVEEAGPRRTVQPRRRLGERLGLSGRLGDRLGARMAESQDLREEMRRGREDRREEDMGWGGREERGRREESRGEGGARRREHSGDSLEMDDGADLRDSLESGTNMVIQVARDSGEEDEASKEEERRNRKELDKKRKERERRDEKDKQRRKEEKEEERERLKDKERRQRQKIEELKEKEEALLREKKRREKERKLEEQRRLREKERRKEKGSRSRRREESSEESDSSSEESGSESESESGSSSGSEESSSGSEDSSSGEEGRGRGQDEEGRGQDKRGRRPPAQPARRDKDKGRDRPSSSSSKQSSFKQDSSKKSEKKESADDQKKAAELRDKLKNYLKKAKEAKEAKKKDKK